MIEEDSVELELSGFANAFFGFVVVVVEDSGRHGGLAEVVCEEISGNEELFFSEEESAMPEGVAGEGDDFESGKFIAVIEPVIDFGCFEAEEKAAYFFKPAAKAREAAIGMMAFEMSAVQAWCKDLAATELLEAG